MPGPDLFSPNINIGLLRSLAERGDQYAEMLVAAYDKLKVHSDLLAAVGGPDITPIEVTGPHQDSVVFNGLNGNLDGGYILEGWIPEFGPSGPDVGSELSLRPNGLTANQFTQRFSFELGEMVFIDEVPILTLYFAELIPDRGIYFRCELTSRTGADRFLESRAHSAWNNGVTSVFQYQLCTGIWLDRTTNITSLVLSGDVPGQIRTGSRFTLTKKKNPLL